MLIMSSDTDFTLTNSLEDSLESSRLLQEEAQFLEVMLPDLHGQLRGKRLPMAMLDKVMEEGVNLPSAVFALDVTGTTVDGTGLAWECGDRDYRCAPLVQTLAPIPWSRQPAAQVLLTMRDGEQGFFADPRTVAEAAVAAFAALGIQAQAAFELEFYLYRLDEAGRPHPVCNTVAPGGLQPGAEALQVYDLECLGEHELFFDDVAGACRLQGLELEGIVAENAPGQFEVNLRYRRDALRAAEDALVLKRLVKGVARRHGLHATFMAKPFPQLAGSGMHVHVSLADDHGANIMAGCDNPRLGHALAGLLATLEEAVLLFAPHANSYRRFEPGTYAPTVPCWAENNRTAALRIPQSAAEDMRIEHRLPGADANPYLVLAAMLQGMLLGMERRLAPPPAALGNAYESALAPLALDWEKAIDRLGKGPLLGERLGAEFVRVLTTVKQGELQRYRTAFHPLEYAWGLERA